MVHVIEHSEEEGMHIVFASDEERQLLFPKRVTCGDVWEPLKALGIPTGPRGFVHFYDEKVWVEFPFWSQGMTWVQAFYEMLLLGDGHVTSLTEVVTPACGRCPPNTQVVFNPEAVWKLNWESVMFRYEWAPLKDDQSV